MKKKSIVITLIFTLLITMTPVMEVSAATAKKPGKPTITAAQVSQNTVTLKWSKAKNAKKYQVFRADGTTWKYWKKVTAKKAKSYKNTAKYKLVKSGKKYKVYQKATKYVKLATVKTTSYKFTGNYSTSYTFMVRAYNGKKAGKDSAVKTVKTAAKPAPTPAKSAADDQTKPETPTTDPVTPAATVPAVPQNVKATVSGNTITVTWDAVDGATSYNVSRKKSTEPNIAYISKSVNKNKYTITGLSYDTTYNFKVNAVNSAGTSSYSSVATATTGSDPNASTGNETGDTSDSGYNPDDLEHLITSNKYSSNSTEAWDQYLQAMLGYYKKELAKRGVSINSKNKSDEFQKLQAIMQVMQDYVGYAEYQTIDCANYPTGFKNWAYYDFGAAVAGTDRSGGYYDGKKYISTIEFYADCEVQAKTEKYLADCAGLEAYTLGENGTSHIYAIICANNVWYNADPIGYMAPSGQGLKNSGWKSVSLFKEYNENIAFSLSKGTSFTTNEYSAGWEPLCPLERATRSAWRSRSY